MPIPSLCRSLLSRKTHFHPLTRLFSEDGYQAPAMVEYTLSQREPNCQTLGGHARPYSYRENLDPHPTGLPTPPLHALPAARRRCGCSQHAAKLGCPIPTRLDWPQLNSALFFHSASLPEASPRRSRERVSPPAAPSPQWRLPEPGSLIRERGERREPGALLSRPQPTSLPHLFRGRDPKPRPAYFQKEPLSFL